MFLERSRGFTGIPQNALPSRTAEKLTEQAFSVFLIDRSKTREDAKAQPRGRIFQATTPSVLSFLLIKKIGLPISRKADFNDDTPD
jgi:hypothetical protein